jgi:hypothetical protein
MYEKNGWKYISIKGKPRERGYAYGFLCAKDFIEIQRMLHFFMYESYGMKWEFFIEAINKDFYEMTKTDFHELFEEMSGIAEGLNANGCKTSVEEIIAWNFYMSIAYYFQTIVGTGGSHEGGGNLKIKESCSAFIAVGDWTETGDIIVAHNSFTDYIDGQYSYIVLDINPDKGHRIIMQTSPCWIWSGTDVFITSAGIIGTETTISGFQMYEKKTPIGYRIRKAMQYGDTLDDYVTILLHNNSADYANSWLFGNIHTNEILRLELGLNYHNVERCTNGYYIGFNGTYDPRIRNLECVNQGFYDVRRHVGSRHVRLNDLMEEHKGKINVEIAKKIISDHYDVYLEKENMCSRTVCSHYDLDAREYMSASGRPVAYQPRGAVDGFIITSDMAKNMELLGKFGSSCGTPFVAKEFFKKHHQFKVFEPYINDRPSQNWTILKALKPSKFILNTKKHKKHNKNTKKLIAN